MIYVVFLDYFAFLCICNCNNYRVLYLCYFCVRVFYYLENIDGFLFFIENL